MRIEELSDGFSVTSEDSAGEARWTMRTIDIDLIEVDVFIDWTVIARPQRWRIEWSVPIIDMHARWHPGAYLDKGFLPDYARGVVASATSLAPVTALFDSSGTNRLTFALSDVLNPVVMRSGVNETSGRMTCGFDLFTEPHMPITEYQCTIRLDTREVPYYLSLGEVGQWWEAASPAAPVPAIAREPMYSTWYSFHQRMSAASVEHQAALAADHGFGSIIVDDGWQTSGDGTGYDSCGDWFASPEKFPNMAAHVTTVKTMGLHYLLWFSVPFVGGQSRTFSEFSGKMLGFWPGGKTWVLDPRFPEVREHLIQTYERAVRDWDVDGLKLDFVDSFRFAGLEQTNDELGYGRDLDSVPVAVDRLLSEAIRRLRELKPEIMLEFRQSYIGPLMRTYGNIFRAADCPNDALRNRVSVLDIRQLSGDTAVHSDMLMWNTEDTKESIALQFINVLFSTPQVSVRLESLDPARAAVVDHWLQFYTTYRKLLTSAPLRPLSPENHYTTVYAETDDTQLAVCYSNSVIDVAADPDRTALVVNGTAVGRTTVKLSQSGLTSRYEIRDCAGEVRQAEQLPTSTLLVELPVPPGGYVRFDFSTPEAEVDQ